MSGHPHGLVALPLCGVPTTEWLPEAAWALRRNFLFLSEIELGLSVVQPLAWSLSHFFVLQNTAGTTLKSYRFFQYINRKDTGSIPAGVIEFFIDIKSFRSHYGPGVDSASNRNEYREYFLGVKAAGA